eukprot:9514683-Ditylum_brightwellii.AAC.1
MKEQFEKQEERIDDKFIDISTAMEKNQEIIMTAIQSKNSNVEEQINQLVQSVMVLDNLMKKQQGQLDGVKQACWDLTDGHDNHMDELDDQIHSTQSQGAPLHRDSPVTTIKGCRFSWTPD